MANKIWIGTGGSPNAFTHPDNWSPSGVPVADDDVYFENSAIDCNTESELDQSGMSGVYDSVNIAQSYTGSIGTSSTALQVKADVVNIGYHNGPGSPAGSPLININTGTTACVYTVSNTGTSADTFKSPVRIKTGTPGSSDNTLTVYKGKVSVGTETSDATTQFSTINVSYDTRQPSDSDVFIGSEVILAALNILGGDVVLECAAADVTVEAGTLLTTGTGAIANLYVKGGVVTSNSTGTITLLDIFGGTGLVDFTKSNAARTISATKLDPGGIIKFNDANLASFEVIPHTADRNITYTAS